MKPKHLLLIPVLALAVYASAILWLKGPVNPWVPEPTVRPTSNIIMPSDIRFVDLIELKDNDNETQTAALLADSQGRTVLLPQKAETFPLLSPPQRLAVSVLTQWQPSPSPGRVESVTTRRFKSTKTGEFREFAPNQYPTEAEWVPVEQ
jgi:hypothetical protein